jgi:ribonuclease R
VIVGVEDFGFFCRLVEFPAEGLIHITSLADDYYYLESETHTLIGRRGGKRHRLGDRIEVRVARVDINRRELDLVLADAPIEAALDSTRAASPAPKRPARGPIKPAKPARSPKQSRKASKGKKRKRP